MRRHLLTDDPDDLDFSSFNEAGALGEAKSLDALELTDAEWRAERKLLRERLARRIPIGFPIPGAD